MSDSEAEFIAELNREIALVSIQLSERYEEFRRSINDSLVNDFSSHLRSCGFDVAKTSNGATDFFNSTKVDLIFAGSEDQYKGIFHWFEIVVNGNARLVRVIAHMSVGRSVFASSRMPEIDRLATTLARLKQNLESVKLSSCTYECTEIDRSRIADPIISDSVSVLIDRLLE
ncbi:hypothetical protein PFLuk1_02717 [Pseudomonas fluorescens]|nr:hypothetical protein PFLuk1_02717 [Pseudomonas fluorescens]